MNRDSMEKYVSERAPELYFRKSPNVGAIKNAVIGRKCARINIEFS